ncbi:Ank3 [Symbiodinium pilosum]|uniref:Ank3 protein n=1 Tax=Symbiodinium pilosum TaxID=2952 RepID=A0A812SAG0_SYMPI|nr:Ank3 [Symbiodinium pilosum]
MAAMSWLSELLTDAWLSSTVGKQLDIEHFDVLEAEGNSSSKLVRVQCKQGTLMLKITRQTPGDALAASVEREALFYHTAWCSLRKIGVGLLDLHAVEIRPDMSVIVLEFVKDGWRTGPNAGLSRCQAEALVGLLARIHAWGLKGKDRLEDCRDGHLFRHGLPDLFRKSVSKVTADKIKAGSPAGSPASTTEGAKKVMDMLHAAAKPGLYEFAVNLVMESSPITVLV